MSIEDEINEIENYIKTLEMNDKHVEETNSMMNDGMSKGLIYDFMNVRNNYRATLVSSSVIKQEQYDEFKKYIDKCEEEDYQKYRKWKQDIVDSGIEFSKDELKYKKLI